MGNDPPKKPPQQKESRSKIPISKAKGDDSMPRRIGSNRWRVSQMSFWISCRGSTTLEWMQFDKKTHTQTHKQKIMKLEHPLKTQVSYWGCHS